MAGIVIKGIGKSKGDVNLTNNDLAETVDTDDAWIREKTGIISRNFAKEKTNTDMAFEAAEAALLQSGKALEEIALVIGCTFTPDDMTPAMACSVSERLGLLPEVISFDVNGACSGFIYGCKIAEGILRDRKDKCALVIGSEKISPFMDMDDRRTCVLFGDGAGAAVIGYEDDAMYAFSAGSRPERKILHCERGGKIKMAGQEVYRFAVGTVPLCIKNIMKAAELSEDDIDYFVCHQANERIIDHVAKRTAGKSEKFYKNLYNYGNTSAASIPIAISDMLDDGLLHRGSRLLCTGFGAGLTYGGMLIEYRGKDNEN